MHFIAKHSITMHSGALHYIVWLRIVLHSLHCIAFHGFALNCTTLYCIHRAARLHCLHCIAFHCILLNGIALHWMAWHCIGWHCIGWHGIALHWIAFHCIGWHGIALRWMAWHCIALDGMAAPLSLAASSISADRWPTHPPLWVKQLQQLGQKITKNWTRNSHETTFPPTP